MRRAVTVIAVVVALALVQSLPDLVAARAELVTLIRTGAAPPSMYVVPHFHGAIYFNWEESSDQTWSVFFSYRGCRMTQRGAFRLTVYRTKDVGQTLDSVPGRPILRRLPRQAVRFSRTFVDHKASDNATLTFPGERGTIYFYAVELPSKHQCTLGGVGFTTN